MYEVYSTTVSEKGQIVIPKKARDEAFLKKGTKLVLVVKDGRIYLEKSTKTAKKIIDDFKDIARITEKNLEELWNNEDDEFSNILFLPFLFVVALHCYIVAPVVFLSKLTKTEILLIHKSHCSKKNVELLDFFLTHFFLSPTEQN